MKFNEQELKMIKKSVVEYEEKHYTTTNEQEQTTLNNLINKLRKVESNE